MLAAISLAWLGRASWDIIEHSTLISRSFTLKLKKLSANRVGEVVLSDPITLTSLTQKVKLTHMLTENIFRLDREFIIKWSWNDLLTINYYQTLLYYVGCGSGRRSLAPACGGWQAGVASSPLVSRECDQQFDPTDPSQNQRLACRTKLNSVCWRLFLTI